MSKLLRKGEGQQIRDEMKRQKLTLDELAEKTRQVDPTGRGVSTATIGRLTGTGRSGRDRCELNTARLVTRALDTSLNELFNAPAPSDCCRLHAAWVMAERLGIPLRNDLGMPTHSTATVERSRINAEKE